jgi:allophanate hydrolase subunit 2
VIATVVSAGLPAAAQLAPGDEVSFELVTEAKARAARLTLSQALASLAAAP